MTRFDELTIFFIIQNIFVVALFYTAYFKRKNPKKHKMYNILAVIWDLLLIMQIEVSRSAIKIATHPSENTNLLNFHIAIAVTVVLLYPVAILSGNALEKRGGPATLTHKMVGRSILLLRTLILITSILIKL